jgi:lipoic acid synthetase
MCTFCAVKKGIPGPPDENEPQHILEAVEKLGLKHVVITSVTRDDLDDGGASWFARVINLLHTNRNGTAVEVLVPDFLGSAKAVRAVVDAGPEIINHNVETVPRLYSEVRPKADYNRSLGLLSTVKKLNPEMVTKSGIMLGLGETSIEVIDVMRDLRDAGCDLLTIGQYLQPSSCHHPVSRFISPEEFSEYAQIGLDMGFAGVASAPLVRSSYRAGEQFSKVRNSCNSILKTT